jgi:hypothetical protein
MACNPGQNPKDRCRACRCAGNRSLPERCNCNRSLSGGQGYVHRVRGRKCSARSPLPQHRLASWLPKCLPETCAPGKNLDRQPESTPTWAARTRSQPRLTTIPWIILSFVPQILEVFPEFLHSEEHLRRGSLSLKRITRLLEGFPRFCCMQSIALGRARAEWSLRCRVEI